MSSHSPREGSWRSPSPRAKRSSIPGGDAGRWSVRELEARARGASGQGSRKPRRRRGKLALHPDQADAIERITDPLSAALGCEVEVTPGRGSGYNVQLSFESVDEALDLARRLRVKSVA